MEQDNKVSRNDWRDAIWASTLSTYAKIVAIAFADYWPKPGKNMWRPMSVLIAMTSSSRRTVQRAVAELIDNGYLVLVAKGIPPHCPEYLPTLPKGCHTDTLIEPEGCHTGTLSEDKGVTQTRKGACQTQKGVTQAPHSIYSLESKDSREKSNYSDEQPTTGGTHCSAASAHTSNEENERQAAINSPSEEDTAFLEQLRLEAIESEKKIIESNPPKKRKLEAEDWLRVFTSSRGRQIGPNLRYETLTDALTEWREETEEEHDSLTSSNA